MRCRVADSQVGVALVAVDADSVRAVRVGADAQSVAASGRRNRRRCRDDDRSRRAVAECVVRQRAVAERSCCFRAASPSRTAIGRVRRSSGWCCRSRRWRSSKRARTAGRFRSRRCSPRGICAQERRHDVDRAGHSRRARALRQAGSAARSHAADSHRAVVLPARPEWRRQEHAPALRGRAAGAERRRHSGVRPLGADANRRCEAQAGLRVRAGAIARAAHGTAVPGGVCEREGTRAHRSGRARARRGAEVQHAISTGSSTRIRSARARNSACCSRCSASRRSSCSTKHSTAWIPPAR